MFHFLFKERMSAANALLIAKQYFGVSRIIGAPFSSFMLVKNGVVVPYLTEEAVEASKQYSKKYLKTGFRTRFLSASRKRRDAFDDVYRAYNKEDVSALNNEGIIEWLKKYETGFLGILDVFNQSQEEFTQLPYLTFRENVSKKNIANVDTAMATTLLPNRPDRLARHERELYRFALDGYSQDELFHHSIEYSLLFYNSYDVRANLRFLEAQIREIRKQG
ncbi:MAG TPA: hypothetical protein VI874_00490, partial [Candidatus Norongarragalinales archaeon]|nr:hypothetical protein [Candidatus Norongarragalinales archaeon]